MNNDMDFKIEYKNLQKNIAPDPEFLERLAREMEDRKLKQRKKELNKKRVIIIAPIITTVCAGAAALTILLNLPKTDEPRPIIANTATNFGFTYTTGMFENRTRFSESEPVPAQLAAMLSDGKTVLYKSDTNRFDYDDKVDDASRLALAERIRIASETETESPKSGEHYMMTLENGDVFKFKISRNILETENKFYRIP